jgi:hypothetical protein
MIYLAFAEPSKLPPALRSIEGGVSEMVLSFCAIRTPFLKPA